MQVVPYLLEAGFSPQGDGRVGSLSIARISWERYFAGYTMSRSGGGRADDPWLLGLLLELASSASQRHLVRR